MSDAVFALKFKGDLQPLDKGVLAKTFSILGPKRFELAGKF